MQGNWFRHVLRVRYQETDQMGVVYHANYLNWFEIGRTELIRRLGKPYTEIEALGLLLPVTELEVKFRAPARYDDLVVIYTRIVELTHLRTGFEYEIRRAQPPAHVEPGFAPREESGREGVFPEGEFLVGGKTRHVWVNRSFRPQRLDKMAPDIYRLLRQEGS
jgi:acyl-CoA thioester hydrolase